MGVMKIRGDSIFILIPSWSCLFENSSPGFYKNAQILRIHADPVIFFTVTQMALKIQEIDTYIFFGLGYYFSKFDLSAKGYILDHRELTGLVISDDYYQKLINAPKITLETDLDVILTEKFTQVPLHLHHRTETQRSFIKGALVREIFSPYKEILQEMMNYISHYQSYDIKTHGHKILTATPDDLNKILVGEKMKFQSNSSYLEPTAGIKEINFGVEKFINGFFNETQLEQLNNEIIRMKETFSVLNYDRTNLFTILECADEILPEREIINLEYENKSPHVLLKTKERPLVHENQIPIMPQDSVEKILRYLTHLVTHDYSIRTLVQAFDEARESIHHHIMYTPYMNEMEKFIQRFSKVEPGWGLSPYEKRDLSDKLEKWIEFGN